MAFLKDAVLHIEAYSQGGILKGGQVHIGGMGGLQLFPGDRRGVHGAVCDSVGAVHDFGADGEAYAGGNGLLLPGVQAVPG